MRDCDGGERNLNAEKEAKAKVSPEVSFQCGGQGYLVGFSVLERRRHQHNNNLTFHFTLSAIGRQFQTPLSI
jgi:hypothetical protein